MGKFWTPYLLLRLRRVTATGRMSNVLQVLVTLAIFWAVVIYAFQYIIVHHKKSFEAIFGVVLAIIWTGGWTFLVFDSRGEEFRDLFVFVLWFACRTITYPGTLLWHVCVLGYTALRIRISRVVMLRPPRFREHPDPCQPGCAARTNHLCQICDRIVNESALLTGTKWWYARPTAVHQYKHLADLHQSATVCHLCYTLLQSLGKIPSLVSDTILVLRISAVVKANQPTSINMQIEGLEGYNPPPVAVEENHEASKRAICGSPCYTGSVLIMAMARHWIKLCKSHGLCQNDWALKQQQGDFQPTRLLKVASGSCPQVRLVVSAEDIALKQHEALNYVALSYCWGQADVPKLTTKSINTFRNSIEFSTLPKTFKDALFVTSALGYEYLFIDSLCIIQDSEDSADWNTEASRMGALYAGAVVTISAANAIDPHSGLFTNSQPFTRDCVLRKDGQMSLIARSSSTDIKAIDLMFNDGVERASLSQRGWAFQERILSKRLLHFAHGQVLFECNDMRASENHRAGVPYAKKAHVRADGSLHSSAMLNRVRQEDDKHTVRVVEETRQTFTTRPASRPSKPYKFKRYYVRTNFTYQSQEAKAEQLLQLSALESRRGAYQFALRATSQQLAEKMEFHQRWYELIEEYSARKLSRHTDKIMAIVGLAEFIQKNSSSARTFYAGVWSDVIPFNLLWKLVGAPSAKTRPTREVPSWTWASVDGSISHTLAPINSPQAINEEWRTLDDVIFQSPWKEINVLIEVNDIERLLVHNGLVHHALLKISGHVWPYQDDDVDFILDIQLDMKSEHLFTIPLVSFKNPEVAPAGSDLSVHGLILRESGDKDKFERVGCFWTSEERYGKALSEAQSLTQQFWLI